MNIITGKIDKAKKIVVYGPEGIGKSTFAAQFPEPLFCDTEGSTNGMNVSRFEKPTSWPMLLSQIDYIKKKFRRYKYDYLHFLFWKLLLI